MKKTLDLSKFTPINCRVENGQSGEVYLICNGEGGKLKIEGIPGSLGDVDWRDAKYIIFDAVNHEDYVMGVTLEFWVKGNTGHHPNLTVILGLFPKLKTRLSFPLEALNSQKMFLDRTPGKLKTVVFGTKVAIEEVDRFAIGTMKYFKDHKLEISNLYISDIEPNYPLPDVKLVDELGQLNDREWPGKTKSIDELKIWLKKEAAKPDNMTFFGNRSRYGGWLEKRFDSTGYFRTEHDGKRWWLVDPDGYAFLSIGLDCVSPGVQGRVDGIKKLYKWLPDENGIYKDAWSKGDGGEYFDFAIANLIRVFGKAWWNEWAKMTRRRLVEWGFNTVGNWSSLKFIRYAKLPYVWPLKDFPETTEKIFRDFPDVFSQEYKNNAERFAEQLKEFEGDPYMIGYFLRNEPQWAFIHNLNIAEELLENEEELASKEVLIKFLSTRYDGDVEKFNEAWNLNLRSFGELKKGIKRASKLSPKASEDLNEFSRIMIKTYVEIPSVVCKRVDPHHMNLGMRYAYIANENLLAGYENFDVFSINCYKITPYEDIEQIGKITEMPVIIGEFHHGALDRGLPATGIRGVATQQERGRAYRYYMETAATSRHFVGAHHFTLNDQAALGRFDGENFQIGCVDICQRPYYEFIEGIMQTNRILYEVADGRQANYDQPPKEIPRVGF
ncbi:hypothetical protein JOD02_001054 [Caldicoprobacter guelmensis]|uniref:hypothetical protein n=1 Tax=Caldicoprobacter guelmensis TaxID=1170224 RepID=UPI00195969BF|nr:hypothetical protein [Caldicoprobacter guelmensis]MBM7582197.1 hypothetical protein [Caldicoprobacter guelmensis]